MVHYVVQAARKAHRQVITANPVTVFHSQCLTEKRTGLGITNCKLDGPKPVSLSRISPLHYKTTRT